MYSQVRQAAALAVALVALLLVRDLIIHISPFIYRCLVVLCAFWALCGPLVAVLQEQSHRPHRQGGFMVKSLLVLTGIAVNIVMIFVVIVLLGIFVRNQGINR